ncbi:AraC family transcriptional regulator [Nocardiopsis sp. NPDC049922]|uniref:AraC family transcriptional regulator n=1 Tax=Nocardiopsis sp. NPDC049922 TaxID=3155157 RepID=UPI0033CFC416
MDPLSDMLRGIRSEGASFSQTSLRPPWTIRCAEGAPLTMITVVGGGASVLLEDGARLGVGAGDTALVRGPEPFRLVDDHAGTTSLVVGVYQVTRGRHERLLRTLPPTLVHREDIDDVTWLQPARQALAVQHEPGAQALIDRVLDLGLVCTLGCWFQERGMDAPAWYRGALDPVAGPALEGIHERPEAAWTVESLAARAKVSRAHFAKRFTEVMGQSPLVYLTDWRMETAEELLSESDASVAQVARAVGYGDAAAFSTAFRRRRGASPTAFRSRAAANGTAALH